MFKVFGRTAKTADREFDEDLERLHRLETACTRIERDVAKYQESRKLMVTALQKLTTTLNTATTDGQSLDIIAARNAYAEAVLKIDQSCRDFDGNMRTLVNDPVDRLLKVFPHVDEHLKRREARLIEYEKIQERAGKSSTDLKMQQSLGSAKTAYTELHARLKEEVPTIFTSRVEYFDPCFEGLIRAQWHFYNSSCDSVAASLGSAKGMAPFKESNDQYERRYDQVMKDFSALSIVGGRARSGADKK
eukprot:Opistho-2@55938